MPKLRDAQQQVAHKLAGSRQRSNASLRYAKSQVSEAVHLVLWLHDHQLALADLRQDLLDQWVATGSMNRQRIRPFLQWLARVGVAGPVHAGWEYGASTRRAMGDEQRLGLLRQLLHNPQLDLRDRFAGSVVLLYGQPLTQIAALATSAININADGQTTLRLARGEIPLPEPLAEIAVALRNQRLQREQESGWLFAGRHAGSHITADGLARRLKAHGITHSTQARQAALLALAARLPAPILAERLGIDRSRAAGWVRLAGAPYAEYVSVRAGNEMEQTLA